MMKSRTERGRFMTSNWLCFLQTQRKKKQKRKTPMICDFSLSLFHYFTTQFYYDLCKWSAIESLFCVSHVVAFLKKALNTNQQTYCFKSKDDTMGSNEKATCILSKSRTWCGSNVHKASGPGNEVGSFVWVGSAWWTNIDENTKKKEYDLPKQHIWIVFDSNTGSDTIYNQMDFSYNYWPVVVSR